MDELHRGVMVIDPLDVSLQDDDLLAEIRLATALMITASQSEHRLTSHEIDQVLGVRTPMPPQRRSRGTLQRVRAPAPNSAAHG